MSLTRITGVVPLKPFRLRLTLSDGRELERDVDGLLVGPIFEEVRLIWGGLPPADAGLSTAVG